MFVASYLRLFPDCLPLIIAPASMLLTWEEEFAKWKIAFPFHNLNNLDLSGDENRYVFNNKDVLRLVKIHSRKKGGSILGVSYNLIEKLAGDRFAKRKLKHEREKADIDRKVEQLRVILLEMPGLVVLDEGHTPRNQRSGIWNTLSKLQTEKRIILSGTPFQNNFGELFNTLRLVRPAAADLIGKEKNFAEFTNLRKGRNQLREKGVCLSSSKQIRIPDEAIEQLKDTIAPFVHVHKGSILQESFPGLRDSVLLLSPPPLQKQLIDAIESSQSNFHFEHKVALVSVHPSLLQHCSNLSDREKSAYDQEALIHKVRLQPDEGVKTRFVTELVRLSHSLKEKVLIFSQYIHSLDLIKDQIREVFGWHEGKEVLKMQGKLAQKHRQKLINDFNDPNSEAKVLLASTKCCSEGINLVGASRVVLLDVVWNLSVEAQAISRAYRLGQKRIVYTYHLLTSGTTEWEKYCRQAQKDHLSELVFSSSSSSMASNEESDRQKTPAAVLGDMILEDMVAHTKLKDMFKKIIYQPKETNLFEDFNAASL